MKRISIADWIYEKIRSAIAIVQDGDTATRTIASGKYVIWKGVLCKAKAAIPSGTTLSSTNLEAVSDGGLNELDSDIETLNSKINNLVKNKTFSDTTNSDGNVVVDLSSDNKIILGITTTNKSVMYYFGIASGGNVVVHFNNTAGASYASQSVSGAVWYIETA